MNMYKLYITIDYIMNLLENIQKILKGGDFKQNMKEHERSGFFSLHLCGCLSHALRCALHVRDAEL